MSPGGQLGALPGLRELRRETVRYVIGGHPLLLEAVAVAERHGAVLARLAVNRDSPGGADLVLAAVALPDRTALVVLGRDAAAHVLIDLSRALWHSGLGDQRQHR